MLFFFFIQIWHHLYGYTVKPLCHDCLIALAYTSRFLLFHHIQTTGALHKFNFIGAVYAIKSSPCSHAPKTITTTNQPTKIKEKIKRTLFFN